MNRIWIGAVAAGIAALAAGAGGAATLLPAKAAGPVHAESSLPAHVDPRLQVPPGNQLSASLKGTGVQVYQCTGGAWTFLEPDATLAREGTAVALHTRGPVWVSTIDGSAVGAAPVPGGSVARPGAVPELLLKATTNRGEGTFGKVSFVQRLDTHGGVAPAGACTNGTQVAVRYTADYLFWVPAL